MKSKCDKCNKPATVHLTEIHNGKSTEKHLCAECAAADGHIIQGNIPISQLLEEFVLQNTRTEDYLDLTCDVCGLSFGAFREHGLLGCPNDYDVFDRALAGALERAQEGAAQHMGKVPHRAGAERGRATTLLRLRAELKSAVSGEDYERAAKLRDKIKDLEASDETR